MVKALCDLQEGIHKQFVEAITAVVNGLKLGSGFDEGVTMGPLISPTQRDRVCPITRARHIALPKH